MDAATGAFAALQEQLGKAHAELDHKRKALEGEVAEFDAKKQKIEVVHTSKKITLNIGGTRFETSRSTLQKDENSMLAAMFADKSNFNTNPDEDGSYFIDRDARRFPTVLAYLRGTPVDVTSMSRRERMETLREAEYYSIQGLLVQRWPDAV